MNELLMTIQSHAGVILLALICLFAADLLVFLLGRRRRTPSAAKTGGSGQSLLVQTLMETGPAVYLLVERSTGIVRSVSENVFQLLGLSAEAVMADSAVMQRGLSADGVRALQSALAAWDHAEPLWVEVSWRYDLYAAQKTLDDAKDTYTDTGRQYNYNEKNSQFMVAKHSWQAAQYTYTATVQDYELRFRTLYAQTADYRQVLAASQTALASQQSTYDSLALKYEQGAISKNAMLTAEDDLAAAKDAVTTAERNLFSAYTTYEWAAKYGILN